MLEWLSKEHIKQWWDDGDDTLEKVALHYGNKNDAARFLLIEITNEKKKEKPIGYFQYYFAAGGAIGIDQFIGDETYLNRGTGEKTIRMFVELIKQKHNPAFIVLDPSPENKRAVRCYEKVGFKHYKTIENEDGNLAYMMRLGFFPTENQTKT